MYLFESFGPNGV